jgi:hypothetical protein
MREKDPQKTFTYLVKELAARYGDMAYLRVIQPRIKGDNDTEGAEERGQQ